MPANDSKTIAMKKTAVGADYSSATAAHRFARQQMVVTTSVFTQQLVKTLTTKANVVVTLVPQVSTKSPFDTVASEGSFEIIWFLWFLDFMKA